LKQATLKRALSGTAVLGMSLEEKQPARSESTDGKLYRIGSGQAAPVAKMREISSSREMVRFLRGMKNYFQSLVICKAFRQNGHGVPNGPEKSPLKQAYL